ncbi:hypothetical protein N0V88_007979 [Collariella sp. IMI 366227]|nr:hypothetical protein N0V88_007979 [Collariella sp. IMI 366227]
MDGSRNAPSRASNHSGRSHRTLPTPTENPKSSPFTPISPMSSLLQERLERSRRVESERMSTRSSTDMLSSSTSSRHVRSPSPTDSQRPRSSSGPDSAKQKKGLGAKEMEQTLSTLHKQNFDLKLELYHRRERQTALEERLERQEQEAKERDQLNDLLVKELEKRDKAVEEAVGMIMDLEKRIEQLLHERAMVRQIEEGGSEYCRFDSPALTPGPNQLKNLEPSPYTEAKTPIRMPSFVSERSENTENLRNVYLSRDSTLSLPRLLEDTPDTMRMDLRLDSPALSDLSESSFVSIYGRVRQRTPGGSRATTSQFHNIGDVLGMGTSPLQRLEKLNTTPTAPRHLPRPQTTEKDRAPAQGQPKSKKEKREALERVFTHGHYSSPHALPPTPDTLSTTTLPHHDTPTREHESESRFSSVTETTTSNPCHDELKTSLRPARPASITAFESRRHLQHFEDRATEAHVAAPQTDQRSGSEWTNARGRDGNGWGGNTASYKGTSRRDSTASSVDTWLRESLKPESMEALDPMSSVSQVNVSAKNGRASPDLFSFPTSSNSGWAAHAMFGTLGGTGYIGAGGKNAQIADMLDAISASVSSGRMTPTGLTSPSAPAAPNRRSSLLARTGAPDGDTIPIPTTNSQTRSLLRGPNRARSNSTDVRPPIRHLTDLGLKQDRAMTQVTTLPALAPAD